MFCSARWVGSAGTLPLLVFTIFFRTITRAFFGLPFHQVRGCRMCVLRRDMLRLTMFLLDTFRLGIFRLLVVDGNGFFRDGLVAIRVALRRFDK